MSPRKKSEGKKISFLLDAPEANRVTLAGDFNNWDAAAAPLKKSRNKVWKKDITLRPGRYEYKFVVDGNWMNDPNNDNRSCNSFGTENSVIEL